MRRTVTKNTRSRQSPPPQSPVTATKAAQGSVATDDTWLRQAVVAGGIASVLSSVMLVARGKRDAGTGTAPLNAPSHWLFGREALRANRPSWRHTFNGLLIHHGSSLFWGLVYSGLLHRLRKQARAEGSWAQPALGAIGITALAAWVDLRLVPERLTPGFEHRLSNKSLVLVYGAFAVGMALGGWHTSKRKGH